MQPHCQFNQSLDTEKRLKLALEFYQAGSEPKEIKWWDGGRDLNDEAMRHRAKWFPQMDPRRCAQPRAARNVSLDLLEEI